MGQTVTPETQYELAKFLKASGANLSDRFKTTTALSLAQEGVTASPDNPALVDLLGQVQAATGDRQQAISSFNKVATLQPRSPLGAMRLADLAIKNGDKEAAVAALKRAQAIAPGDAELARQVVEKSLQLGRVDLASATVKGLQAAHPKFGLGWKLEGDIARARKDLPAAIAAYRKADQLAAEAGASVGNTELAIALHGALVESGKRYALVLVSGAGHRVGFCEGTEYTQGILMYAQDGAYFTQAAERDLMLRLNFARFNSPRAVVQMQPLQLAGGIQELDMLYDAAVPAGCRLVWEYQTGGQWRPITAESSPQFGGAALVPLRALFIGTQDLMPALRPSTAQVTVSRRGNAFVHVSTNRVLSTPSKTIRVRLLLEDFDAAAGHTVDCRLIVGGALVAATSHRDEVVDGRSFWREFRWTLGADTASYRIRIDGAGVTGAHPWHVAERYDLAL